MENWNISIATLQETWGPLVDTGTSNYGIVGTKRISKHPARGAAILYDRRLFTVEYCDSHDEVLALALLKHRDSGACTAVASVYLPPTQRDDANPRRIADAN